MKGARLGFCLTFIQTETVCSVVRSGKERRTVRKWREARAKTLLYFTWIGALACLSSHPYARGCVPFVFILSSWHSAVQFVQFHFIFYSVSWAGQAQRAKRRGAAVRGSRYKVHHFLFIRALSGSLSDTQLTAHDVCPDLNMNMWNIAAAAYKGSWIRPEVGSCLNKSYYLRGNLRFPK